MFHSHHLVANGRYRRYALIDRGRRVVARAVHARVFWLGHACHRDPIYVTYGRAGTLRELAFALGRAAAHRELLRCSLLDGPPHDPPRLSHRYEALIRQLDGSWYWINDGGLRRRAAAYPAHTPPPPPGWAEPPHVGYLPAGSVRLAPPDVCADLDHWFKARRNEWIELRCSRRGGDPTNPNGPVVIYTGNDHHRTANQTDT